MNDPVSDDITGLIAASDDNVDGSTVRLREIADVIVGVKLGKTELDSEFCSLLSLSSPSF
jgi:hypothetical protein